MNVIALGLILGAIFGAAARAGRFCLLRGLKGLVSSPSSDGRKISASRDLSALRAFALAAAVALAGTQALNLAGLTDLGVALPMQAAAPWAAMLAGGAIFGLGMVLANSCGARALVLLAGGNLRSLMVLLSLGLAAQATLTGVLAPARMAALEAAERAGADSLAGASLPGLFAGAGLAPQLALALAVALPVLALAAFALPLIRRRPAEALMAAIVGATVAGGWWVTFVSDDPFDPRPLASLSFVGPLGDSALWLMLSTGRPPAFGTAVVGGTLIGAFATALLTRGLRLETFGSPGQTIAAALGGALMGFGGVLALGCSIGQGLSGVSTLSLASLVSLAGILAGTVAGLTFLPRFDVAERTSR